jgi:hypothetical protein
MQLEHTLKARHPREITPENNRLQQQSEGIQHSPHEIITKPYNTASVCG